MDNYIGQLLLVGFNFAPQGWAFCNGQLLPISQNTALFSLLGTNYGGNGTTTFGLPNLQSNVPLGAGQGPGLSDYELGQTGGAASVSLISSHLPAHVHTLNGLSAAGTTSDPTNALYATTGTRGHSVPLYQSPSASPVTLSGQAIAVAGGSVPHNNLMPTIYMNWIIALTGVFPPRP